MHIFTSLFLLFQTSIGQLDYSLSAVRLHRKYWMVLFLPALLLHVTFVSGTPQLDGLRVSPEAPEPVSFLFHF